jgi:hypothetical protein
MNGNCSAFLLDKKIFSKADKIIRDAGPGCALSKRVLSLAAHLIEASRAIDQDEKGVNAELVTYLRETIGKVRNCPMSQGSIPVRDALAHFAGSALLMAHLGDKHRLPLLRFVGLVASSCPAHLAKPRTLGAAA